ncbi:MULTISPECIES: alpha/beta fold hydrolase [Alteromonas]|jgi:pimeloyl-ACP methyl ester carboxylesterase|uniref:Alpha/beta fold superfamily hydrolase n=1 Tax=Alteromonas mediterranea 615 TaxID=1300253 RepID=S5AI99_9ALTE|nr:MULTISPECIES: alpha/beta hydrolase [Alteromonas]AGP78521.1 alpha/beta fold superfamily hydrolase [Alteromonas mediterranea 615]MBR9782779.1 alpha/beta hydrolase [Gammaproteobacteria bacterium]MBR9897318.1 alpha/beta hydrolase [Gammaproteobacteria bacterium]NQY17445.1 alpha/beta hydrolase [Alteromonas sp.]|tara:strand:+ start:1514 stop:2353 length:840 start_codon:yes stop_codon:yes gene_type:complete
MIETEFNIGNLNLAALDNQGSGSVVIGLHGYLDNAESLRLLAPYLQTHRFVAIDLAGHGRSGHRTAGAHYNQADYLQDLYALIESQGWDEVILLGHSLGGILASLFAALFPEKVSAVISIDACGPLTEDEDTTVAQMRDAILSRHAKSRNKLRVVELEDAVKARCKISDIPEAHARSILSRNLTQDAGGHCFWSSDPKLRTKSMLRLTEKQAEALMRAIVCPILFIGASNSFKNLETLFPKRKTWFLNAQYEQFVGGHHIHMENTDDIGVLIRQFVEQL